jgi:hypothetical protein
VSCCMSGYISGCVTSYVDSLLRCEEGGSVIDILIETGDNSREDVDGHKSDIDTGGDIEVGKVTNTLIELGSSGVGYRAVDVHLKISACD